MASETEVTMVGKKNLKLRLLGEHGYRCRVCQRKMNHPDALTIDHIVPRGMGGSNANQNLQLLCKRCHRAKTRIEQAVRDELQVDPLYRIRGPEREAAYRAYMLRSLISGPPVPDS